MPSNRKLIKKGTYIGLYLNPEDGTMEIWQIYQCRYEQWDKGITNKEEALEVWRYAEREYPKGL